MRTIFVNLYATPTTMVLGQAFASAEAAEREPHVNCRPMLYATIGGEYFPKALVELVRSQRDAALAEAERLRIVIRTGGAMYRAERATMGIAGGIDPTDAERANAERGHIVEWLRRQSEFENVMALASAIEDGTFLKELQEGAGDPLQDPR